jgi:hypothetical protein
LFIGALVAASVPAVAQVPNLPPPPEQAVPAVNALSPAVFQACLSESVVVGVVQTGSAVAPVPIQVNDVLSPVRNVLLLDVACAYFSPKVVPAACEVDETIYGSLPDVTAVTVPQPASLAATEVYAAEAALNAYGAPVGNQLSAPLWEQLGCTN